MDRQERNFLNDVLEALDDWDVSYDTYHENGAFCIDVTIDDIDEWGEDCEEIWNSLEEVCNEWDAGLDSNTNCYYIALERD